MATKRKSLDAVADDMIKSQLDQIDEAIESLDEKLRRYDTIKEKRDRLMAARRALLGGTRTTGAGTTKVRQEDIVDYMKEKDNKGVTPSQLAERFGVTQPTISSHLYRGKDERFLSKNGLWYLRDPKSGLKTADDIEEEE